MIMYRAQPSGGGLIAILFICCPLTFIVENDIHQTEDHEIEKVNTETAMTPESFHVSSLSNLSVSPSFWVFVTHCTPHLGRGNSRVMERIKGPACVYERPSSSTVS
ncbi:sialidase-4 [Platysternon megacephalum]|uniref:Sialidase-4 n=1 Tax=Platysternon megacephalum TaxID=55544 RepID=A0A4D9EAN2_9SAUR|nr:sialidase-4 [Platysternon megacephalum]